jgi:hypothetical protein
VTEAYAHDAELRLEPGGDERGPGGAVTVALCGSLDHEPPCPLAPHHNATSTEGDLLHLRVVFAADPSDEAEVRRRIDQALASRTFTGPEETRSRWEVVSSAPSEPTDHEREAARRFVDG